MKVISYIALWAAVAVVGSLCGEALTPGELPTVQVGGRQMHYYQVKEGESIYDVMAQMGLTRQEILENNPQAADGLRKGMRLYFVEEGEETTRGDVKAGGAAAGGGRPQTPTTITVRKGQSLYGVAHQYGISVDELCELNPAAASGLRPGMVLRLSEGAVEAPEGVEAVEAVEAVAPVEPVETVEAVEAVESMEPVRAEEAVAAVEHVEVDTPVNAVGEEREAVVEEPLMGEEVANGDTLQVAVLLPFMLHEEEASRTTQLFTEFYRGILMAVDNEGRRAGQPVRINAYDTDASMDTLRSLLRSPALAKADLVVAPDNAERIAAIAEALPETYIFNIFGVKDTSYLTHPNIIQANIPHGRMYQKAIDAFVSLYPTALPVFLSRREGVADKETFTSALKARLDTLGRLYKEVSYDHALYLDELEELAPDTVPVVFVPSSGSRSEFARISSALLKLRENVADPTSVALWGYPEWVTFRGENHNDICTLGATIYSRYYASPTDPTLRALQQRYHQLFGMEMIEAVPTQGVLGFDVGTYIIQAARALHGSGALPTEVEGAQSQLLLESGEGSAPGLVNDALYILRYLPEGRVEQVEI